MKSFKVREASSWASSIIRHILLLCVCFLSYEFFLYFHFFNRKPCMASNQMQGSCPPLEPWHCLGLFVSLTLSFTCPWEERSCAICLCSPVSKVVLALSNWLSLSPESHSQSKVLSAFAVVRLQSVRSLWSSITDAYLYCVPSEKESPRSSPTKNVVHAQPRMLLLSAVRNPCVWFWSSENEVRFSLCVKKVCFLAFAFLGGSVMSSCERRGFGKTVRSKLIASRSLCSMKARNWSAERAKGQDLD